jgi:hypothetical protein
MLKSDFARRQWFIGQPVECIECMTSDSKLINLLADIAERLQ